MQDMHEPIFIYRANRLQKRLHFRRKLDKITQTNPIKGLPTYVSL